MQRVDLQHREHEVKIGDICGPIQANVIEDSLFYLDGIAVGFYIKDVSLHSSTLKKALDIANSEFNSDRVPKRDMRRSSGLHDSSTEVRQYCTIIGSVPAKPQMRRNNHRISSVHGEKSAQTYIKSMMVAAIESEALIKKFVPAVYEKQKEIIESEIPKKWRFGNLFTSSISNYNISAPFHVDKGNLIGCVNVILVKKRFADGGNTTVPDYGLTFNSCNNSMLVYPAYMNVHGVTPIEPIREDGYRNSLIFYPLKAFRNG